MSVEPLMDGAPTAAMRRSLRERLDLRGELVLALLPTLTILAVLGLVEVLSRQRLLYASLASSAFLIYLDPQHTTNSVRTLGISHLLAAGLGFVAYTLLGPGYLSGGSAMLGTIAAMILLRAVHPPAVSTSLSFAFRTGEEQNLVLFALALALVAILVLLEQATLWLLANRARFLPGRPSPDTSAGPKGEAE